MATLAEMPVFVDTNLGTHIAISAPPDIKAGDLKRKLEEEHVMCFPSVGEIKVRSLMVKRRSILYHLSDLVHVRSVLQNQDGTWFLFAEAYMTPRVQHNLDIQLCSKKSKTSDEAKPPQDEYSVPPDETKMDKPCEMFKSPYISNEVRVEKQCYRKYFRGETSNEDASLNSGNLLTENVVERKICKDSLPVKEVQSYITSEVASVTHIISRYFSEFDETDTCNSPAQGPTDVIDQLDQCKTANLRRLWGPHPNQNAMTTMGSAREEHVKQRIDGHCLSTSIDCMHLSVTKSKGEILTPKRKFRRTEVGRRLLPAANEMGISTVTIHRSLGRVHAQHNLDGEF